jgi:hypothetical protein
MKTMVLGVALTVGFAALALEDAIAHDGGGGIDLDIGLVALLVIGVVLIVRLN